MSTTEEAARRMFRYFVPVDDCPHTLTLTCDPVAFATSGDDLVDFWAEKDPRCGASDRVFQVFGTGHPLPPDARYVGTCPRTRSGLIWHLYELVSGEGLDDEDQYKDAF